MQHPAPIHQTIAERAYALWQQAGQPGGRDEEFWLQAEAELTATSKPSATPLNPAPANPAPPQATLPHQVPPAIATTVKPPGRRPARQRLPKRA